MKQIGFYFLFILSFVNIEIWGMKAEEEEEVNWEEEFNNNYCISDENMNILNLSDLEGLTLSEDKNKKLDTLKEQLNNKEINIVEFCTDEENTIKFKVVEEGKEIEGNVTYFSCIDKSKDMGKNVKLCIGIVEDTILITKEGELRNFEDKNKEIKETKELFLVKKPVKESIIFDKSFEANNAINDQKTEFELSLLYLKIGEQLTYQGLIDYKNKQNIFFYGYNKLNHYWDAKNKNIYFFQYYTGNKVYSSKPINIENLEKEAKFEVYKIFETRINNENGKQKIKKKKGKKSCCQKCCDNCF